MLLSEFAQTLEAESSFTVLGIAKALKSQGKDIVELEIEVGQWAAELQVERQ